MGIGPLPSTGEASGELNTCGLGKLVVVASYVIPTIWSSQ